jgi:hypothetical protein
MMAKEYKPQTAFGFSEAAPWTDWNKASFTYAVAGQAVDVVSTIYALSGSCHEANPIYGEAPSTLAMIGMKTAIIGLNYVIVEYSLQGSEYQQVVRNWVYSFIGTMGVGAAIWNYNLDCY